MDEQGSSGHTRIIYDQAAALRWATRMEGWVLIVAIIAVLGGAGIMLLALFRLHAALRKTETAQHVREAAETALLEGKLRDLAAAQNALAGQCAQLGSHISTLDQRLGDSLKDTAAKTAETLGGLQTRLAVIDEAQKNLTDLSGQVVGLQQILSNKQARGAWGQGQMEAIVRDALPIGAYEFQAKLSNNSRPDCVIRVPGSKSALVIDSKFPLEAFEGLKTATTESEKRAAEARVRIDMGKHIKDIAEKYLIAGETQAPAIMFVPSESLYAEVHASFSELIQKAQRAQVAVVSPNILLLAVNTVLTVMKDARMREQANLIQREVGLLLKDVGRLTERVDNLRRHFAQADGDLKDIAVSAEKVTARADRIERVELTAPEAPPLRLANERPRTAGAL